MPKNIILKNKKISSLKKFLSPKNYKNGQKKGKKWPFFGPGGPNFAKIKKRNGRTDGTEIVGPSGKIPGTN